MEGLIAVLREKNNDLQSLRSQSEELEHLSTRCRRRMAFKQMPKEFVEVQQISSEAYGALKSSFRCTDDSHDEHSASLCLDVEYIQNVRLKVAITYEKKCQ
jgi:hypothetical protein